jgi:ATP-dependent Clp protease protease subunit
VTVKIAGIAASAASVIAMAENSILMSPVSCLVIHNPFTLAIGDEAEMERVKNMLAEVKNAIINAYRLKTDLSREKISKLMDDSTCFNAKKAVELGFADGILYDEKVKNIAVHKVCASLPEAKNGASVEACKQKLNLLKFGENYGNNS